MTTPDPAAGDMHTRDMSTLDGDGPALTQFESSTARRAGMGGALAQRPRYSPVAQPGMVSEIHWHTVRSEESDGRGDPHREPPARGMIGRLNRPPPPDRQKGRRRRG